MRSLVSVLVCSSVFASLPVSARAEDWPQWLGPNRDSHWNETGIVEELPEGGPKILWRAEVAGGYSGPAVAKGRVYLTDYVRTSGDPVNDPSGRPELTGKERVLCFDAKTGKELWKHEYDCPYKVSYPAGPRATPTVADGKVYTLGSEGDLLCLDAEKGTVLWQKQFKQDFGIESPIWGFCGHPLVDGDKLICLVGGQGSVAVAFDKNTGRELWRALSAKEPGYCPPSIIEHGGARQLLIWHPESLNSLNPETGEVYWSQPLVPDYGMSIMAPRLAGDLLFASGIGAVAAVFQLDPTKPAATEVWRGDRTNSVYCANSTPLIEDGVIYGTDCDKGSLRAVSLSDGKILWETFKPTTGDRRAGHGTAFIVKNGDRYFLFNEKGELIIAKLSPVDYYEVSRAKLLEPTGEAFGRQVVWSHPAFADRCIFVRNDRELVCASLAAE